jgi:hypothetical protein
LKVRLTTVAFVALLALGAGACGDLPAESNVVDLRVLGIKSEPAGFLINLQDLGSLTDADLTAQLTALVVDPSGQGMELQLTSAVGCPDYIDTITSASMQMSASGAKICPPPSATSAIPPPIGPLLTTTVIVPPDMPQSFQPDDAQMIQWEPVVSSGSTGKQVGLTAEQVQAFVAPEDPNLPPALNTSLRYNRAFGTPGIVNLTFGVNGETVTAIKNVVYWPQLDYPGEQPNKNPTLGDSANPTAPKIRFYSHRDDVTGNPDQEYTDDVPEISITRGDKLYVEPNYKDAVESYRILVYNADTDSFDTRVVDRELIRFYFYTSRGKFDPEQQFSELSPILTGGTLHTDSEWLPPEKHDNIPTGGELVTIWLVTHDERAGTDWASRTILLLP